MSALTSMDVTSPKWQASQPLTASTTMTPWSSSRPSPTTHSKPETAASCSRPSSHRFKTRSRHQPRVGRSRSGGGSRTDRRMK
ncbi:hypothetical protein CRUP_026977 [Coryphaenoides rupestris]|nr:hypothetical protein CRUP_026977 [Coryphaenoides rupestris]